MRLIPSDPDVQTIIKRIENADIKLQPDFQRGEVWGETKKKRLIDSILRDWHVPPIHVIEVKQTAQQEVLDGQQRLVAIRDFAHNKIRIDGYTLPLDDEIVGLDGLSYDDLPIFFRKRFERFTIRMFNIIDYRPEEPAELFYRLNQPANLTAAEQRNAFFGPAREQVKDLVNLFEHVGLTKDVIGFSNTRMSYDDIISKVCYIVELGYMYKKVTATAVTNKYRSGEAFSHEVFNKVRNSIEIFAKCITPYSSKIRLNKATLFSWLCFIIEAQEPEATRSKFNHILGEFIVHFESIRLNAKQYKNDINIFDMVHNISYFHRDLLNLFNDKASFTVADAISILSRDIVLWVFFAKYASSLDIGLNPENPRIEILNKMQIENYEKGKDVQQFINDIIENHYWGASI